MCVSLLTVDGEKQDVTRGQKLYLALNCICLLFIFIENK